VLNLSFSFLNKPVGVPFTTAAAYESYA